ncbi:hypothetical protein [Actinophytocola sp.]|uniref:hypothetical protein n=1 Tax=Actinophytocola sp. TaxID=1872138 RepID=UPI003D6A8904
MVSDDSSAVHVTAEEVLERAAAAGGHLLLKGLSREELLAWRHAARVAQLRLWRVGTARLQKWTDGDSLRIVVTDPTAKPADCKVATTAANPVAEGKREPRAPEDLLGRAVRVPAKLPAQPYPLVEALRKGLEARERDWWRAEWQRSRVEDWIPDVPRQKKGRVLRILQAIIAEAEFRGYRVRKAGHVRDGYLEISIGWDDEFPFTFGGTTHGLWLRLQPPGRRVRALTWSDTKTEPVERQLGKFFDQVEHLRAAAEERREEERRRTEDRRRRWEDAMATARRKYAEQHREQTLRKRIENADLSDDIRAYSAALLDRAAALDGDRREDVRAWAEWVATYADRVDPRCDPEGMPTTPKPSPDELSPYLRGWSPYGPG